MEEYTRITISQICKSICSGGTPTSTCQSYYGGTIPWLNTKEVDFNRIYTTEKNITESGLNSSSAKWIEKNAVIVAMYGATAGKVAIAKIPLTTNQACCNLMIDSSVADYRFVYYALYNEYERLASLANGGAQQNLNAQRIKDFDIPFPNLPIQNRIADILSSLDDKIELNRRINDNLEQQAQALFKSWFVDFEPFQQGKFIESELGLIPEGWRVGSLSEIVDLLSGFVFQSSSFTSIGEYQLVTIKNVQDGLLDINGAVSIEQLPARMPQYCLLSKGDILLSLTGNVGRVCVVDRENLLLNQRVAKIQPICERDRMFAYTLFRQETFKNILIQLAKGTAQLNLSPIETAKTKIVIPDRPTFDNFARVTEKMFVQILNNQQTNIQLSELRDTLLPKLMSGELQLTK